MMFLALTLTLAAQESPRDTISEFRKQGVLLADDMEEAASHLDEALALRKEAETRILKAHGPKPDKRRVLNDLNALHNVGFQVVTHSEWKKTEHLTEGYNDSILRGDRLYPNATLKGRGAAFLFDNLIAMRVTKFLDYTVLGLVGWHKEETRRKVSFESVKHFRDRAKEKKPQQRAQEAH